MKSAEVSVHADVHLQTPSQKHGAALNNGSLVLLTFEEEIQIEHISNNGEYSLFAVLLSVT